MLDVMRRPTPTPTGASAPLLLAVAGRHHIADHHPNPGGRGAVAVYLTVENGGRRVAVSREAVAFTGVAPVSGP
jgi:hypothetical protein